MTHLTNEEWEMYIKNELTSERRDRAEDHLYSCDHCLELYLGVVAELEADLPDFQHMEDLTDRVMNEIQHKQLVQRSHLDHEPKLVQEQNLELAPKLVIQELKQDHQQKPAQKPGMKVTIKQKVLPFYQTAIFHYTLAAVATIVLMMTGVFQNISHYTGAIQSTTSQEDRSSVTEGIVNITFSWLDSFETKHKEANNK